MLSRGLSQKEIHRRLRILLVCFDRNERLVVVRNGRELALLWRGRHRNSGKALLDRGLHLLGIEVADRDHRHEVRPVPVVIELHGETFGKRLEVLSRADRNPFGVLGALQHHRELEVLHAGARVAAGAPFLDDDRAFFLHFGRVERRRTAGPVLHDVEPRVEEACRVGRHLEHVDRFVERRIRVEVRAESHPHALDEVDNVLLGEPLCAVEHHVLDEVGDAALRVGLENRSRVHDEPELGALLGLLVAPDDVTEAVRELAAHDVRIGRERRIGVLCAGGRYGRCEREYAEYSVHFHWTNEGDCKVVVRLA